MTTKPDVMEYIEGSLVQHGPYNDRIYLMKLGGDSDGERVAARLIAKAQEARYSKIFAKIPDSAEGAFLRLGFRVEARIPKFYNGCEGAVFLGFYLTKDRLREEDRDALEILLDVYREQPPATTRDLPDGFSLRPCVKDDVPQMSDIYSTVFPTYPFPITDQAYLRQTMETHVHYFGVEVLGRLIALSSAEMDEDAKNVEMTDFATLPDWRGYGLAIHLLRAMEHAMPARNIKTAYTIARSKSPGMNVTFAKMGYHYGGRVINSTNISGQIESMNVWYKHLLD